jgi:hypothetical protein
MFWRILPLGHLGLHSLQFFLEAHTKHVNVISSTIV